MILLTESERSRTRTSLLGLLDTSFVILSQSAPVNEHVYNLNLPAEITKPLRLFLPHEQIFPPTMFGELKLHPSLSLCVCVCVDPSPCVAARSRSCGEARQSAPTALTELWSTSKQRGFNWLGLQHLQTLRLCVCTLGGTSLGANPFLLL